MKVNSRWSIFWVFIKFATWERFCQRLAVWLIMLTIPNSNVNAKYSKLIIE